MAGWTTTLLTLCTLLLVLEPLANCYQFNQALVANAEEGQRLAQEIETLLADPNVPEDDKEAVNVELSTEVHGGGSSQAARYSMDRSQPIDGIRCELDCCKVIVPPETVRHTRTVSFSCVTYYSERYSRRCGAFGWRRCSRHRTRSRRNTCYRADITYSHRSRPCPEEHKTCCEGFFWYRNCCINISRLREIIAEIRRRIQQGK